MPGEHPSVRSAAGDDGSLNAFDDARRVMIYRPVLAPVMETPKQQQPQLVCRTL